MNWEKLKEKYPKSYNEIKEYSIDKKLDGENLMRNFLSEKGYYTGVTWISSLRDYENKLNN